MKKTNRIKYIVIIVVTFSIILLAIKLHMEHGEKKQVTQAGIATVKNLDMTNGINKEIVINNAISVDKVIGMPNDFIRGIDMSEIIAQENSGSKFYDANGKQKDVFQILSESGINYVKVRIWNDPYNLEKKSYGGGNCDINNAVAIAKRVAKYGMKLMVSFQYSDFWADSARQFVPKAWRNMSINEKEKALYTFTRDSLQKICSVGGIIGIVQLGNETDNALCGEKDWTDICRLLKSGSKAVRETAKLRQLDIKVAVDFANPNDKGHFKKVAESLEANQVDYDIFATTYYSYWSGTLENLTTQLKSVVESYDKEVMVAETSYVNTLKDTDGMPNTINSKQLLTPGYEASIQGQAKMIRDVIQAVVNCKKAGIGVFYADGAWISVGKNYKKNKKIWEKYGSGWATKAASSYDEQIKEPGGSDVDNEAFFDASGKVLPSINAFSYAYSGARKE